MNIVLIMADQFAAHALARLRDTDAHFRTPNLDRLAAVSTVFTEAYTSFPLCAPARSSMMTGMHPHQLGIMSNEKDLPDRSHDPGQGTASLGHWFTAAGYDCAYAGKWHARQASATAADGFAPIHPFGDEGLVEACTDWLSRRDSGQPFLLVASFDDPHTICEYARSQPMPYGNVTPVDLLDAPPLPANFPAAPFEPEAMRFEQAAAARMYGTGTSGAEDWRHYRAAYAELVTRVDRRIGQLLDCIELASTAVVFISDHGDGDASHGWNQKTALHQECIKVPFMVHVPGQSAGVVDIPVPAVLGILPTLCEVAGIDAPDGLAAGSLLAPQADRVVVQTAFPGAADLPGAGTSGRAVILEQWKYAVYDWGKHREQLHDLSTDPGEQRNLAVERQYFHVLEQMREHLLQWSRATGDVGFLKRLVLPSSAAAGMQQEIFKIPF